MPQVIRNSLNEILDTSLHQGTKQNILIILAHGLTGNKDRPLLRSLAKELSHGGWECIRISYAGNGMSHGEFQESNITKNMTDLTAVIDQIGGSKKIIYIGHSMGSAVGTLTAARDERIKGLISLAGLSDTKGFIERELIGKQSIRDDSNFPISQALIEDLTHISSTIPATQEIRLPWLLFHGLQDYEVPPQDSEEIHRRYRGKSHYVSLPDGDHLLEKEASIIAKEILAWLNKYF